MTQKSSAQKLLESIQDMHAAEQIVTRETLAEHAGLTKTQIDDRLKYLEGAGLIVRVQRGVYVPAQAHAPARQVYLAICPDGTHVLEVGDQKLVLTPREARNVGMVMAGAGQQFAAIQIGHMAAEEMAAMSERIRGLQRQLAEGSAKEGAAK